MTETQPKPAEETGCWADIFTGRLGVYTLVLGLGMGLFAINQFVVATIMPTVLEELGGVRFYSWAFSLFAVGAIVGAASAHGLREAFGLRPAYAGAGLMLGLGLTGAALAPDMPNFVGWRLVQGIGGGALASQGYGLVAIAYPLICAPASSAWCLLFGGRQPLWAPDLGRCLRSPACGNGHF